MQKKWTRWLVGGALAALAGIAMVTTLRPQPVLVDTVAAEIGRLRVTVDEDGVTRIKEKYIVSTPLAGRLQRITLDVGDPVTADQTILARMQATDPSLLDPRALAQATARVQAAERRLEAAGAELKKAESELEYAELAMSRARELLKQGAGSSTELEAKELEFRTRTQAAHAAGFAVDIAEYELDLEKAALLLTDPDTDDSGAKEMELQLKAPINGRVLRIYQESSAVLTVGTQIMELGNPLDLEIVTDVLSYDAVKIAPGAEVELVNWGGEHSLRGEVRTIEPSGFTKISALGVEEQRVNAIIDLVDPPSKRLALGDGFRIDSRIVVWQSDSALKIPTSALFRIEEQWNVFIVTPRDLASQREVTVGVNNGIEAQILAGIDPGERVIIHPSDAIKDGVLVGERRSQ